MGWLVGGVVMVERLGGCFLVCIDFRGGVSRNEWSRIRLDKLVVSGFEFGFQVFKANVDGKWFVSGVGVGGEWLVGRQGFGNVMELAGGSFKWGFVVVNLSVAGKRERFKY